MARGASGPNRPKPSNRYLRYSGLGIQLLATLAAGGWLGYVLDQALHLRFPFFLLLFVFLTFGGVIYQLYRTISKE